jgi:hypothetical protein
MTRLIDHHTTADEWPVPAYWRREAPSDAPVLGRPRKRSGLGARLLAAVLAAESRFRDAQRMERMCDRMRRDIALLPKGSEARTLERRIGELQRWS